VRTRQKLSDSAGLSRARLACLTESPHRPCVSTAAVHEATVQGRRLTLTGLVELTLATETDVGK
jgi:hypothetical protein